MCRLERLPTEASDEEALILAARRFAWTTLVFYAALSVGQWLAHAGFPTVVGPLDYDYLVGWSLMGALILGALYEAALVLRPSRPREPRLVETR